MGGEESGARVGVGGPAAGTAPPAAGASEADVVDRGAAGTVGSKWSVLIFR